jgi:hypothetical protein
VFTGGRLSKRIKKILKKGVAAKPMDGNFQVTSWSGHGPCCPALSLMDSRLFFLQPAEKEPKESRVKEVESTNPLSVF